MIYFQSLTRQDLEDLLFPHSEPRKAYALTPEEREKKTRAKARFRSRQIFQWVYARKILEWDQMTDLSIALREWLKLNVAIYRLGVHQNSASEDGTRKILWDLKDHKTIESVIIPAALREKTKTEWDHETVSEGGKHFAGRSLEGEAEPEWSRLTACISSQVGCTMGCKFCLTGIQGLDRHLEVHEIVTQVLELRLLAPITNIVFMGMGEPLHNLDNVIKACKILLDQDGLNFSKRKVTVSTSGLVPAIRELGKNVDVSLAVSLNATTDEQRSEIMPVNKRYNIEELLNTCREFPLSMHRRITFEYVLLRDFNDSLEDARRLKDLLKGIPHKINLIPFNEHSGSIYKRPEDKVIKAFQHYLVSRGETATVRISRGRDILAACGQLRSIFGTARGSQKHRDWHQVPTVNAE